MKIYKIATVWKVLVFVFGPVMVVIFGFLFVMPFVSSELPLLLSIIFVPMSLAMIAVSVIGFLDAIKAKFILAPEKIEWISTTTRREMAHDEIKGYTVDDKYIVIHSKIPGKKKIKLTRMLGKSDEIVTWLSTVHLNLEEAKKLEEFNQIISDESLGFTPAQRQDRLNIAKKMAATFNIVAVILAVWAFFWPRPYSYIIIACLVLPVISAIVLKIFDGLIRLVDEKGSAYPSLTWAIAGPSLLLFLRALLDFSIFDFNNAWWISGILTIVLLILLLLIGRKEFTFRTAKDYGAIFGLAFISFAYAFGATLEINCAFDDSEPDQFQAQVLDKRISSGKTTSYYLELSSWGPQTEGEEASVSKDEYEYFQEGDTVNVYLMKGQLDIPWFFIGPQ